MANIDILQPLWELAEPITIHVSPNPETGLPQYELACEAPKWLSLDVEFLNAQFVYLHADIGEFSLNLANADLTYRISDRRIYLGVERILGRLITPPPTAVVTQKPVSAISLLQRLKTWLKPQTLSLKLF
jgi:hypothetical protein